MQSVVAWLVFPCVAYAVFLGIGLLVERLFRFTLPAGLHAAVGLCAALVIVTAPYELDAGAPVAAPLLLALAAAGFWLGRRELRQKAATAPAALAGVAAYLAYLAPVLFTGHWTWAGYNFVNDPSVNAVAIDHIVHHGAAAVTGPPSAAVTSIGSTVGIGYPLAPHYLLGILRWLLPGPLVAAYQPFIALMVGIAAMALCVLATRSGLARWFGPVAGAGAVTAALAYEYALQGAIKEMTMIAVIATTAAVGREALRSEAPVRGSALTALTAAAGLAVYSTGGVAYAGAFVFVLCIAAFVGTAAPARRRLVPMVAVGALVFGLAWIPTAASTLSFVHAASGTFSAKGGPLGTNGPDELGQLLRPLPVTQAAGVWPVADYRIPIQHARTTADVLIVIVLVFGAIGLVAELLRRRPAALILFAGAALATAVMAPRLSPYLDAKLLVILSPTIVFAALVGAHEIAAAIARRGLAERRLRARRAIPIGALAGVVVLAVLAGPVWSDVLTYHDVQLAPTDRMQALQDIAKRFRGRGPTLINEWEEWAKYWLRDMAPNPGSESISPIPVVLRTPGPIFNRYFDLDEQELSYVERFPLIVDRRSPDASRPPANFALVYRNRFYNVWQRESRIKVVDHLPLQPPQPAHVAAAMPSCAAVRRFASHAHSGEWLVAAEPPETETFNPMAAAPLPPNWVAGEPYTLNLLKPGRASGGVRIIQGGRYRVWVRGTFGRRLYVYVDGRRVGSVKGINTPGQWLDATVIALRSGIHQVSVVRFGGSLRPGDGALTLLGLVDFQRETPERLVWIRPANARRLCNGRPYDWIEIARR